MILFIASEVMFFVAWFWAYFNAALFPADLHQVARTELLGGVWPPKGIETFDPWHLPLLNTLILLTSGTTVTWAHHALLENDRKGLKWGLSLTIILGALFTCVQAYEYSHAAFNFSGNIYGATFFMATGFHGAHVLIGTIFLIVCLIRAYLGHFTPDAASRLRVRRLVLALRRRGVAVPVRLHLRLGRRRRTPRRTSGALTQRDAEQRIAEGRSQGRPFRLSREMLRLSAHGGSRSLRCVKRSGAASPAAARAAARARCSRASSTVAPRCEQLRARLRLRRFRRRAGVLRDVVRGLRGGGRRAGGRGASTSRRTGCTRCSGCR